MTTRKHFILSIITLFAWGLFYLIGSPSNYFVDWDLANKILLSLITMFAIVPFIAFFVLLFIGADYLKTSFWFAFYASFLVAVFDFITIGLLANEGTNFLFSHWPQTIGYFYVWVSIPLVGVALERIFKKNI